MFPLNIISSLLFYCTLLLVDVCNLMRYSKASMQHNTHTNTAPLNTNSSYLLLDASNIFYIVKNSQYISPLWTRVTRWEENHANKYNTLKEQKIHCSDGLGMYKIENERWPKKVQRQNSKKENLQTQSNLGSWYSEHTKLNTMRPKMRKHMVKSLIASKPLGRRE